MLTMYVCTDNPFSFVVVATQSLLVLLVSLLIVILFGVGASFMKVTTDPVELWASPNSRSRQEKDYFDQNFQPFYRTEQVFIKAIGIDNVSSK